MKNTWILLAKHFFALNFTTNILKEYSMKQAVARTLWVCMSLPASVAVLASPGGHSPGAGVQTVSASTETAEGEIKKVNKEAGKITIKHGELKSLGMPPMTMVFHVQDQAMLEQVKTGDKVNFRADKINGRFTIIQIETRK